MTSENTATYCKSILQKVNYPTKVREKGEDVFVRAFFCGGGGGGGGLGVGVVGIFGRGKVSTAGLNNGIGQSAQGLMVSSISTSNKSKRLAIPGLVLLQLSNVKLPQRHPILCDLLAPRQSEVFEHASHYRAQGESNPLYP